MRSVDLDDDGLSALQRNALAGLSDAFVRSSNLVGDDEDAWAALYSLAQRWVTRYPLVEGYGNFGSVDDDPPADPQYTEVRLAPIAHRLHDFPNALVNGPLPHNLRDVAQAALDPDFVLVPDFPTGGVLARLDADAYTLRARAEIADRHIVIRELPYGVAKGGSGGVLSEIIDAVRDGGLPVRDVLDYTDRDGIRVVIEVRPETSPETVLVMLFDRTALEVTRRVPGASARQRLDHWLRTRDPTILQQIAQDHGDARRTTVA
jgi:DNA gyrase subunit A